MDNKSNTRARTVKVKDLRRVEIVFFIIGFIAAFLALLIYTKVFQGGVFLTHSQYDYYKGMDDTYGKFYKMETLVEENGLFTYETDDLDDYMAASVMAGMKNDEYAQYYPARSFKQFKHRYVTYVGIGVTTREEGGKYLVASVIDNSPAAEAGIEKGDAIISIDGKKPASHNEVSDLIGGDAGTTVVIVLERDGKSKTVSVDRAEIAADTVDYKVYDKAAGIGYVKVTSFSKGTTKDFRLAVKDLKNQGCDKLILDLRDNTGGLEVEGIDMADCLLPSCVIISETNNKGNEKVHKSDQSSIGMKYVILVNEKTASSSEIVVSAVKANKAGVIIGTKTYGKGLIQKLHEFEDGSAFKYTTGEYVAADGSKVNKAGVTPDVWATGDDCLTQAVKALK